MSHLVSQRFLECFEALKVSGRVRSARQFAKSLDYLPQNFSQITKYRRDVTIDLIQKAVLQYQFNPHYLYTGEEPKFIDSNSDRLKVLTIITDRQGEEKIMHVPYPAQAGYAGDLLDQEYIEDLPSYNLPGFEHGTFRSFDVSGDSMEPSLNDGDKVICSFVEPGLQNIKNNDVYVLVLRNEVLVKRVIEHVQSLQQLQLISDNPHFDDQFVDITAVREMWRVISVLSSFNHQKTPKVSHDELIDLKKTINRQSHIVHSLKQVLDKKGLQLT